MQVERQEQNRLTARLEKRRREIYEQQVKINSRIHEIERLQAEFEEIQINSVVELNLHHVKFIAAGINALHGEMDVHIERINDLMAGTFNRLNVAVNVDQPVALAALLKQSREKYNEVVQALIPKLTARARGGFHGADECDLVNAVVYSEYTCSEMGNMRLFLNEFKPRACVFTCALCPYHFEVMEGYPEFKVVAWEQKSDRHGNSFKECTISRGVQPAPPENALENLTLGI
jgi:hypothetical protein